MSFLSNTIATVKRHASGARTAVVVTLTGAAAHANAALDISAITAAGTDVAAVGGAVFAVYVGAKVFKWVRTAL